jgi:ribosomal protein S18 acetylase RimI-like enzyme
MTGITIRAAEPADYGPIGEITVAAYAPLEDADDPVVQDYMATLRDVASRARDAEVLVAVDGAGTVLGAVTLVLDSNSPLAEFEEPGAASFRMLAVAPEAQGKGVGTLLAEHCVARARAVGAQVVLIHSRPLMTVARGIYGKMGFRRYPEIDFVVEDIKLDGFRLDL